MIDDQGSPAALPGLYPPNEENLARYEAAKNLIGPNQTKSAKARITATPIIRTLG